jgi:hypothetical protein
MPITSLDTLSQYPDHRAGSENSDVTLLQPDLFCVPAIEGITVDGPKIPLLRDISVLDLEDPIALVAQELLKN